MRKVRILLFPMIVILSMKSQMLCSKLSTESCLCMKEIIQITGRRKDRNREIQLHQYEQQQRKIARVEGQIDELENWSTKAHVESRKKGGGAMGAKEYFRMKAKKKDVQIRSKRKRLEGELEKERIQKPQDEIDVTFNMQGRKKKGKRVLELKNVQEGIWSEGVICRCLVHRARR